METRNRGLNRKGFAPEIQEAMNLFNQDMFHLKWFPEIEIEMANEEHRSLTSDEKKDTLFVKRTLQVTRKVQQSHLDQEDAYHKAHSEP